jgi:large subunit ribosomal protein L32e
MTKQEFIDILLALKGIGKAKVEALYAAGFTTIEKIQQATLEDLTAVDGISDAIATSIKQELTTMKKPSAPVREDKAQALPAEKEKTETKTPPKKQEKKTEKQPPTPKSKRSKEEKEEKEDEEEGEEGEAIYEVKKKAHLPEQLQQKLRIRTQIKKRTPTFLREEWFRYKRIPKNWRRPDGLHSKMRMNFKYRPSKVRVGFRGPKEARGLHPSGFEEVMVYNIKDLDGINTDTQAARIGGTVGSKKRLAIIEKAKELDIRLLNK